MPMCAFRAHVASHTVTGLTQHGRHAIGGGADALAGRVTGGSFGRSVRYGASGSIQVPSMYGIYTSVLPRSLASNLVFRLIPLITTAFVVSCFMRI